MKFCYKKYRFLFILVLLIIACNSSKNDMDDSFNCSVHPPSWLIGTWQFTANSSEYWHFYQNSIEEQNGHIITDLCKKVKALHRNNVDIKLIEVINSDSLYVLLELTITNTGRLERYDSFFRLSNGNMGHCYEYYKECTPFSIYEYVKQ